MLELIVFILVLALVLWLVWWILGKFGLPATVHQVIGVVFAIILLLVALQKLGLMPSLR